jgi:hypothetical protein
MCELCDVCARTLERANSSCNAMAFSSQQLQTLAETAQGGAQWSATGAFVHGVPLRQGALDEATKSRMTNATASTSLTARERSLNLMDGPEFQTAAPCEASNRPPASSSPPSKGH